MVFKSKVPFRVKVEAFYHLSANLSYPLMIVLSTLLMPAMIIRSFGGWFQMLVIDLPLFLASTFSISSFYLVSQKELFPRRWPRTFLFLPFLMALGIGLTLTNTRAVIEALLGIKSSFKRTPKYRCAIERPIRRWDKNIVAGSALFRGWNCWWERILWPCALTLLPVGITGRSRSCCSLCWATGTPD